MPIYTIQAPDGKTYDIEGPEGATADQLGAFISSQSADVKPKSYISKSDRFVQGLKDPIDGGAQFLTKILPESVVQKGNALNNWLADKTGLVGKLPEGGVNQQVKETNEKFKTDGVDWWRMGGNVLSPSNLAIASRVPVVAGLGSKALASGASGAASGALSPVASDDYWGEKQKQVGIGAVVGAALPAVGSAVSRVISPNASVDPAVQMLRDNNVRITAGQALGGMSNRLEEKLTSVPFLGDAIASARNRAKDDFNKVAINRAVAPIGEKVDEIGQEGVKKAGDLLSKAYDDALSQIKYVKFDQQFATDLQQLKGMAQNLEPGLAQKFDKVIADKIGTRLSGNGSMLAEPFKKVDSDLGKLATRYQGSGTAAEQEFGDAVAQLQSLLKQQAMRTNSGAAEALSKADEGWANLVRLEGASKAAMNTEGVFTPAQLGSAVRQADKSVRDRSTARGTALMQDLAGAGQKVIGNKVPNSGTIDRGLAGGGLGALAYANPVVTGSLLGAGILGYTPIGQRIASGLVASRPQLAQPVASNVQKAFPFLVPVGAGLLE